MNISIGSNYLIYLIFLCISLHCFSQDDNEGTHEKWEYALETTGDILQFALPISAGLTTIIKKDWEGTKQFAFSYATTLAITYSL
jgi:hypothetical protein